MVTAIAILRSVKMSVPTVTLNDGAVLPAVGFGTYPMSDDEGVSAIVSAIEVGYRLLDTAGQLRERGGGRRGDPSVGGRPRSEILVASKIPGRHHAYEEAIASTRASLERLGLDYLDLHLIHWPNPSVGLYTEAWKALGHVAAGRTRPVDRSIQLRPRPPGADHRGNGRDASGQPGRAAPVLPAGVDA